MSSWRNCPICGEYKKLQHNQITCSMKCRARKKKIEQENSPSGQCASCKKTAPLIYEVLGKKTCSKKCRSTAYSRIYRIGYHYIQIKHEKGESKFCEYCAKSFYCKRYDQRFCSSSCCGKWCYHYGTKGKNSKEKIQAKRIERYKEIGGCILCGTLFENIKPLTELGGHKNALARGLFHKDHIICKSKGGTDDPSNLRWLCWFCNLSRRDMDSKYDKAIAEAGKAFWKNV